jgi:dihydrofolate synthase/folylpolyglutamate synthase
LADFSSLARLEGLSPRGMKLGLVSIDALCERLGRPERAFPSVLIGGTNGKGSCAATLSAIAHAGGIRSGLYTSPHLIAVTERVRVGETDVSEEELDDALRRVFSAADAAPQVPATYFEVATAAAFWIFASRKVELGILEVGLGGRFDATNVAPAMLSAVTSIGLDHVEDLGPTKEAIAVEKAGIFRAGRPVLYSAEDPGAAAVLRSEAERLGAEPHDLRAETAVEVESTDLTGTRMRLRTPRGSRRLSTPLPGRHQAGNVAVAVRAAELLEAQMPRLGGEAAAAGVAAVRWPGRLERLSLGRREVVLDGCHNLDGAVRLAEFLEEAGLAGRADLVFGAMADKDIEAMAAALFPRVRRVRLVPAPGARAAPPAELSRRTAGFAPTLERESVEAALRELRDDAEGEPIIVAGSLYLVGQARAFLLASRAEKEKTR